MYYLHNEMCIKHTMLTQFYICKKLFLPFIGLQFLLKSRGLKKEKNCYLLNINRLRISYRSIFALPLFSETHFLAYKAFRVCEKHHFPSHQYPAASL